MKKGMLLHRWVLQLTKAGRYPQRTYVCQHCGWWKRVEKTTHGHRTTYNNKVERPDCHSKQRGCVVCAEARDAGHRVVALARRA